MLQNDLQKLEPDDPDEASAANATPNHLIKSLPLLTLPKQDQTETELSKSNSKEETETGPSKSSSKEETETGPSKSTSKKETKTGRSKRSRKKETETGPSKSSSKKKNKSWPSKRSKEKETEKGPSKRSRIKETETGPSKSSTKKEAKKPEVFDPLNDEILIETWIFPADHILPPVKYRLGQHPCCIKYKDTCMYDEFGIRIHAWGDTLKEAFEQCGMGLYSYMVDLKAIEIRQKIYIEVEGDDLHTLLYRFLDELRYIFCTKPYFYCKKLTFTKFTTASYDYTIGCNCFGEDYDEKRHSYGKSVIGAKFLGMAIINEPQDNRFEIYCTVDSCCD